MCSHVSSGGTDRLDIALKCTRKQSIISGILARKPMTIEIYDDNQVRISVAPLTDQMSLQVISNDLRAKLRLQNGRLRDGIEIVENPMYPEFPF